MLNFWRRFPNSRGVLKCFFQNAISDQIVQEEEEDGNWGLFSFAYNQWLSKASEIVANRRQIRIRQAGQEGANYPDDMTDQVSEKFECSPAHDELERSILHSNC